MKPTHGGKRKNVGRTNQLKNKVMETIDINKSYDFADISKFAKDNGFQIEELGKNIIGTNFLILEHEYRDKIYSFVLDGELGQRWIYKCIYKD